MVSAFEVVVTMKVSICIPVYNSESTIEQTLRSLMRQTYEDLEIIVADNASTDDTPNIIRRMATLDSRVRHERFEEFVTSHGNMTRCIHLAQGEYTAIFHADDIYHTDIVEREADFLDLHPEVGAVFTTGGRIDGEGRRLARYPIPIAVFDGHSAVFDFKSAMSASLQYGHIFLTPSAMVRTEIYQDEIREWPDHQFGGAGDLYIFLRIAKSHKLAIINQELMDWRTSISSTSYRYVRARRSRHDIFLALDYYIKEFYAKEMTERDRKNYQFLLMKDDTIIAISHLIDGNFRFARGLMPRLVYPSIIVSASRFKFHMKCLAAAWAAWVLSFVPLGKVGRSLLSRIRFG